MKLPAILNKNVLKLAMEVARRGMEAVKLVSSEYKLVEEIASELRYNPGMWMYLHPKHPFFYQTSQDIADIYPKLPKNSVIVVHSSKRWCLVAHDNFLVPMLFLHRPEATRFYRLINGKSSQWMSVILKDLNTMLTSGLFLGGEEFNDLLKVSGETSSQFVQEPDAVSKKTGAGFHL